MRSNEDIQKDVQDAIKWEPLLYAAEIGVIVKDGMVTLTGMVDSYTKKLEAEIATKKVAGVRAVVEKIEVKFWSAFKDDTEIATDVLNALNGNADIPKDKVIIKVENGWIILDGELKLNYQKQEAVKCIEHLTGVVGITNNIIIKSETLDEIDKKYIESALTRNESIDDRDIAVNVSNNRVTLKGSVDTLYQKDEAGRIAWNAPGVWAVHNELEIEY